MQFHACCSDVLALTRQSSQICAFPRSRDLCAACVDKLADLVDKALHLEYEARERLARVSERSIGVVLGVAQGRHGASILAHGVLTRAAAQQLHTLLLDETHFFVGSLGTASMEHGVPQAVVGAEYYAPCFDADMAKRVHGAREGDLLFLALPVSQAWRSALAPNATVTYAVASSPDPHVVDLRHAEHSPSGRQVWDADRPQWRRGLASKRRTVLYGKVKHVEASEDTAKALHKCFVAHHADAAYWTPGSDASPHTALWVRFQPERIYYVGGFGDEHYIGWIDPALYRGEAAQGQRRTETNQERANPHGQVYFG